jgi:hypothetical protein
LLDVFATIAVFRLGTSGYALPKTKSVRDSLFGARLTDAAKPFHRRAVSHANRGDHR